jgi:hypothetical protein
MGERCLEGETGMGLILAITGGDFARRWQTVHARRILPRDRFAGFVLISPPDRAPGVARSTPAPRSLALDALRAGPRHGPSGEFTGNLQKYQGLKK